MKGTAHQSCKYIDITSLQCYVICLFVIFQYFTFHSRTALMHHMNSGAGMRSRDGAVVVRALASHQCVPGSIHMWVEFVVGSLLFSEGFFSGYSSFPSPQKPTFPNSNSIWIIVKHFIMSLWLGWSRRLSPFLTLNLHFNSVLMLHFMPFCHISTFLTK